MLDRFLALFFVLLSFSWNLHLTATMLSLRMAWLFHYVAAIAWRICVQTVRENAFKAISVTRKVHIWQIYCQNILLCLKKWCLSALELTKSCNFWTTEWRTMFWPWRDDVWSFLRVTCHWPDVGVNLYLFDRFRNISYSLDDTVL